jgi:NhaP-type Na+/H+ or K+/H+ antiporter
MTADALSLNYFMIGVAAILITGFIGRALAKRTGITHILWLMVLGIIIIPVFGLFSRGTFLALMPDVASVVITIVLFNFGLGLNAHKLIKQISVSSLLLSANFIASVLLVFIVTHFIGYNYLDSALIGFAVGGTSAVILPFGSISRLVDEKTNILLNLEAMITEPLSVIFVLILIVVAALNTTNMELILTTIVGQFSTAIVLGALFGFAWVPLMAFMQHHKYEYSYVSSLAVVFILYIVTQDIGGSGPMAALIFGLLIANGEGLYHLLKYKHNKYFTLNRESRYFNDLISFITTSAFFVYFGGLVIPQDIYSLVVGVAIGLTIIIARQIGTWTSLARSSTPKVDKFFLSSMMTRGTGAAVSAALLVAYNVFNPSLITVFFSIILVTVFINGVMFARFNAIYKRLKQQEPPSGSQAQ